MANKKINDDINEGRVATAEEINSSLENVFLDNNSENFKTLREKRSIKLKEKRAKADQLAKEKEEKEKQEKIKIEASQKKLIEKERAADAKKTPDNEAKGWALPKNYTQKLEDRSDLLEKFFESAFKIGFWVLFVFMFAFPPASILFTALLGTSIAGYFLTSEYWKDEFKDLAKATVKVDEAKYDAHVTTELENYSDKKRNIEIKKEQRVQEEVLKLEQDLEEEKKRNSLLKQRTENRESQSRILQTLATIAGNQDLLNKDDINQEK